MGCYINPSDKSKEAWLKENAVAIDAHSAKTALTSENVPICLVNNGPFTAAAVGFSEREIDEFLRHDGRPKQWFMARRDAVRRVSDLTSFER